MFTLNFIGEIIGGIIGGIFSSIAFVWMYNFFKKPSLKFELPSNEPVPSTYVETLRLYHIKVKNIGRSSATNCKLIIYYKQYDGADIFVVNPGKWDENPEPVMFDPNTRQHFFQNHMLTQIGKIDIMEGGEPTFCFLIKYQDSEECFGFSADNYKVNNFMLPERRLTYGEYLIKVKVIGNNVKAEKTFLLQNFGPNFQDIKIEPKKGIY